MISKIDTRGKQYAQNVAIWYDGTIRPAKGHTLECKWFFDGQVWYHSKYLGENI